MNVQELMTGPFSTTGKVERAAISVVLMEAVKEYFTCKSEIYCGIPEIRLEGSEQDYKSILDRINQLKQLIPDFSVWLL